MPSRSNSFAVSTDRQKCEAISIRFYFWHLFRVIDFERKQLYVHNLTTKSSLCSTSEFRSFWIGFSFKEKFKCNIDFLFDLIFKSFKENESGGEYIIFHRLSALKIIVIRLQIYQLLQKVLSHILYLIFCFLFYRTITNTFLMGQLNVNF